MQGTIGNCFRHGGFVVSVESAEQSGSSEDVDHSDLHKLQKMWNRFSRFVGGEPETMVMEGFGGGDNVMAITKELTDIEIAAKVVREWLGASSELSEPSPKDAEDSVCYQKRAKLFLP